MRAIRNYSKKSKNLIFSNVIQASQHPIVDTSALLAVLKAAAMGGVKISLSSCRKASRITETAAPISTRADVDTLSTLMISKLHVSRGELIGGFELGRNGADLPLRAAGLSFSRGYDWSAMSTRNWEKETTIGGGMGLVI